MSTEDITNRLNEVFEMFDTVDYTEAEREQVAEILARDISRYAKAKRNDANLYNLPTLPLIVKTPFV